jgi:hypothetical protein
MDYDKRQALLAWLQEQFDTATEQGGNTIDLAGEEIHVLHADIVDNDVLVEFSNGDTAAFSVEEA